MRRPSPATLIASVALFVSLGGTSLAASHYLITSKSQIAPSVRKALRGHRGPRGHGGPQGVAGAQGAVGAQGPRGPQGPTATAPAMTALAKVLFTHVTGSPVTIQPGQQGTAVANCPWTNGGAYDVTGGGYDADPGLNVFSSKAINSRQGLTVVLQWVVQAENDTAQPLTLTASAVCSAETS